MIEWKTDYQGFVGEIIDVVIAQRADCMFDVWVIYQRGDRRELCATLLQAKGAAQRMVEVTLVAAGL